jgi:hypothetical protein
LWDRKISDIEVHFWIILAHINFVLFRTFSLIRISGIPEPTEEGDTTEKVRKIISDIDPSYEITNIIRSHRVGKPDEKAGNSN